MATIGILGGTGIYQLEGLNLIAEVPVETPYGRPSDNVLLGTVDGITVAFLPRHGRKHAILPSEINYRANIFALKSLGVKYLFTLSACGSLKEEARPGDVVLVDQFINRTFHRQMTFFGDGIVGHVSFGNPTCEHFRGIAERVITPLLDGNKLLKGGTYLMMEGPAFSTKAESNMHRQLGCTVVGMTAMAEALLAREAEMAYCCLGLVTDYDCWKEDEAHVDATAVIQILHKNAAFAQKVVRGIIQEVNKAPFTSEAHDALKFAIMTPTANISAEKKASMKPIFGRYLQ
eukprot:PhF_6_TR15638/c0_g1_i1/m.24278/K00772/mtaP, MTAP; 5'-methylthioadenosine phosphorylase